jgi:hypothetical protein
MFDRDDTLERNLVSEPRFTINSLDGKISYCQSSKLYTTYVV